MNIDFSFYQEQLAGAIQEKNPGLLEKIIQAFRIVPRHPFVDHYYLHEPGKNRVWTRYEQEESAVWYERVYCNDALITQVDQYGRPLSSSSQPGVIILQPKFAAFGGLLKAQKQDEKLQGPAA